jgi:hypothetical protein
MSTAISYNFLADAKPVSFASQIQWDPLLDVMHPQIRYRIMIIKNPLFHTLDHECHTVVLSTRPRRNGDCTASVYGSWRPDWRRLPAPVLDISGVFGYRS